MWMQRRMTSLRMSILHSISNSFTNLTSLTTVAFVTGRCSYKDQYNLVMSTPLAIHFKLTMSSEAAPSAKTHLG